MIFNSIDKWDLFIYNIFMQIFFSFIIISGSFYASQHNQKYLDNEVTDVINNSNVLDGLSTPLAHRSVDKTNLDILTSIYDNESSIENILSKGLSRSIYLQIIIFIIGFLVSSTVLKISRREYFKNLINLIIIFMILGCLSSITDLYIKNEYTSLSLEDIYNIIQDKLDLLTPFISY